MNVFIPVANIIKYIAIIISMIEKGSLMNIAPFIVRYATAGITSE